MDKKHTSSARKITHYFAISKMEKCRMIFDLMIGVFKAIPWYVKISVVVVPCAIYFASSYLYKIHEDRNVLYEDFNTVGYNVYNGVGGDLTSNNGYLSSGVGEGNKGGLGGVGGNKVSSRKFWVKWTYFSNDSELTSGGDRSICYYAPVTLPSRKAGENTLQIGFYLPTVLRIRWSKMNSIGPNDHGVNSLQFFLPLSRNFNQNDSLSDWNEAVDGKAVDKPGVSWVTVKAVQSCSCAIGRDRFNESINKPFGINYNFCNK